MLLDQLGPISAGSMPLRLADVPQPVPAAGEVLLEVLTCGVCHTELDEIEGRTPPPHLPMILGHQVVGRIAALGDGISGPPVSKPARGWQVGDRVGVAWIGGACGTCAYCRSDRENLCPQFVATGRDRAGGYAERMTARSDFLVRIPESLDDVAAAPLLCAGAIGYRSLRLARLTDGQRLGLTGFGSSARQVLAMVRHQFPRSEVHVFARSEHEREIARSLGAAWAGETSDPPPTLLDAIIDTTPAWTPVVAALAALAPGGRLVINAIRKEPIDREILATLDYPRHLWLEKEIQSVANVTRRDVQEFLDLAGAMNLAPATEVYPLEEANQAIVELRTQHVAAAKVLRIGPR
jgi:propanol-preferring alcohol dehydrogenase